MIKAIIFDFDGLIVDTETPSYYVFSDIYNEYGVELTLETYSQCIGTSFSVFDPYTYLSNITGKEVAIDEVKTKFRRKYRELLENEGLRPGVREYLEEAKDMNLKIGLASSSTLSWIKPHLERFNLDTYFSSILTSDNVKEVKPNPELYIKSLENLGVNAEEAISFEDSLNGFKAAKSAGLNCVVVPNEVTRHFQFNEFDLLINSMQDIKFDKIIELINNKRIIRS
ncbi:haloacid dehalogenase [Paenibacillus montaniterrae]|uniref:Haloacid dehalogenase n=1 Tax=Paenibacillus montaniterrae TaxID=429341 RepID=A0A919YVC8_9BACL|nr:HAD family hydrolase [Paenibacillus montaniterrae]GIP17508.1 haloacid dehalogenase [Paenibacillus montaniterrae]